MIGHITRSRLLELLAGHRLHLDRDVLMDRLLRLGLLGQLLRNLFGATGCCCSEQSRRHGKLAVLRLS